jgi:RimJ/RimL family protein N-acetyltransferase
MTMPPIFHTKRLLLRPPAPDDAPSYQRHFADYEVIRHLSVNVPWPFPSDGVLEFINAVVLPKLGHDYWFWVICLNHDRETVIGAIDLWRPGHPENRGFWLGREFWGQGYMTEAVAPVMDHAFDALGFDDVILSNAIGNDRSRRIKEKTGAVLLGSEPASFVDPVYTEHEIWQLTKAAWIAWRRENPAT